MGKSVLYKGEIRTLNRVDFYTTLDKDPLSKVKFVPEPEGTLVITENGTGIDVKEKAYVDVNVQSAVDPVIPTIAVSDNGTVTVSGNNITTTTHTLSSEDDADFVASNILKGVSIFGLAGTAESASGIGIVEAECTTLTEETILDGTTITPDSSFAAIAVKNLGKGIYIFKRDNVSQDAMAGMKYLTIQRLSNASSSCWGQQGDNQSAYSNAYGMTDTTNGTYFYLVGKSAFAFRANSQNVTMHYKGYFIRSGTSG